MGKKNNKVNRTRETNKALDGLRRLGFAYPAHLDEFDDPDTVFEIYMHSAVTFFVPLSSEVNDTNLRTGIREAGNFLSYSLETHPVIARNPDNSLCSIACKRGCSYCCTLRVTTRPANVLAMAFYLRKKLSPESLVQLIARMDEYVETTGRLDLEKKLRPGIMCPLNVEGDCLGYEYRPNGCRTHHSFSLQQCIKANESPDDDVLIPQDQNRYSIQELLSEPVSVITVLLGLNNDELEFIPALLIALKDPDASAKYLAHEPVFEKAHNSELLNLQRQARKRPGFTPLPVIGLDHWNSEDEDEDEIEDDDDL